MALAQEAQAGGCDLTSLWTEGGADQPLFQTIRRGIADTLKPHSFGPDIRSILAYLSTLDAGPEQILPTSDAGGNAAIGERLFWVNCGSCHSVNGRGGQLGPDLSRVGGRRSRAALAHKIRHASSYIASIYEGGYVTDGYQPVTLVTSSGRRIRAVGKNEVSPFRSWTSAAVFEDTGKPISRTFAMTTLR
jgi:mono/diheme cytochrome c family protein